MGNIRGTHSSPGVYTKMTDKKQIRTRISLIANKNEDVSNISIGGGSSSKTNVTINGNVVEENGLYYVVLNAKPAVLDDITISMDINDEPKQVTMKKGSDTAKSEEVDKYCKIENVTVEPQSTSVAKYSVNEVVNPNGDGLFTVTWKNYDGEVLEKDEKVPYGTTPEYNGNTPTRDSDVQYTYTFSGWTPEITEVTGTTEYTAVFTSKTNEYNITFNYKDENGEDATSALTLEYGTKVKEESDKILPPYYETPESGYTFSGWNPEITEETTIKGPTAYIAQYISQIRSYTIRFLDSEGRVLQSGTTEYGTTPTYNGPDPTKEQTDEFTYTFDKWDPELSKVVEKDTDYIPIFKEEKRKYNITFNYKDENGEDTTSALTLEYGTKVKEESDKILPPYYETPESGYTFSGWNPEITEETIVERNAEYTAEYSSEIRKYKITFNYKNENDEDITYESTLEYGTKVKGVSDGISPKDYETAESKYTFIGWKPEITEETTVTGDTEYTAQFKQSTNTYTVTWKNHDGTVLEKDEKVPYGTTPEYNGATPTRKGDAQYYYTFDKWDPTITGVTGNAIYKAKYTRYIQKYKITWENHDGTVLETDTDVPYGTTPEYNGATPTKKGDDQYSYNFTEWKPTITGVTGNATYTAQFEEITNTYTVEWLNSDGTILETDTNVAYGTLPSYDGKTPTIEKEHYICDFTGWDKPINEGITGDTVYTAIYSETPIQYELNVIVKNGQYEIEPQKETYTYNEEVTITIIPIEGYQYKELTDKIRITGNMTLTYECTPIKYDLTVNDSYKGQQAYGDDISEYLTYEPQEGMSHKWMEGDKEFTGTTMPNRNLILTGVYIEESTENKTFYYGTIFADQYTRTTEGLEIDNNDLSIVEGCTEAEYIDNKEMTIEYLQPRMSEEKSSEYAKLRGTTQKANWIKNNGFVLYIAAPSDINNIVYEYDTNVYNDLNELSKTIKIDDNEYRQFIIDVPALPLTYNNTADPAQMDNKVIINYKK